METVKVAFSAPNSETQNHEKRDLVYVYVKQIPCLKMQIMKHGIEVHAGLQRWMFASAKDWPV